MGARDKGEKAAVEPEFPDSPLSARCRHLIANMRDARVYVCVVAGSKSSDKGPGGTG
jgi:hypothetical protein